MAAHRILGIDPGSRLCGYGVVDARGAALAYVECGVIAPGGRRPLASRLAEVYAELRDVIRDLRPDAVAVEGLFFARNAQTALRLGHARGVALCAAGEAGLAVFEYAPAFVKQTVSGHGRAAKPQVGAIVRRVLGLRRPPAVDAADALAVAITHARTLAITAVDGRRQLRPAAASRVAVSALTGKPVEADRMVAMRGAAGPIAGPIGR